MAGDGKTSGEHLVIVVDTSLTINAAILDRLDLLGTANRLVGIVPEAVLAELTHPVQRERVERALATGDLHRAAVEGDALVLFEQMRRDFGRGESAALALAVARSAHVGCDEGRAFMRRAIEHLGPRRQLNTPAMMVRAIECGLLTVAEADAYKNVLAANRYRMNFGSFAERVRQS